MQKNEIVQAIKRDTEKKKFEKIVKKNIHRIDQGDSVRVYF